MVKVIVAPTKFDAENVIGQFIDDSHYDEVISEDCDFYAPSPYGEDPHDESRLIFKGILVRLRIELLHLISPLEKTSWKNNKIKTLTNHQY